VIVVIIGATGTISKSFRKYVSTIPGNHEVKELQKTVILGTAHILRKFLILLLLLLLLIIIIIIKYSSIRFQENQSSESRGDTDWDGQT
jgi:uncharacterized membrane protein YdbT with pleckstrin-like domain